MARAIPWLRRGLRRFGRDDGTATVEFVIVFPLLVFTLMMAYIFFDMFRSDGQAAKALYVVTDLVSRRESVTDADLDDLYVLYDRLLPRTGDDKVLRITSISFDGTNYVEEWSWVRNPPAASMPPVTLPELTSATLPVTLLPNVATDDSILLVEARVPFTPIVDIGIPPMIWNPTTTVRPRFIAKVDKPDD